MRATHNPGRVAGLWYLLLILIGPLRLIYIPNKLFVEGNAAATVNNIAAHEMLFRLRLRLRCLERYRCAVAAISASGLCDLPAGLLRGDRAHALAVDQGRQAASGGCLNSVRDTLSGVNRRLTSSSPRTPPGSGTAASRLALRRSSGTHSSFPSRGPWPKPADRQDRRS